MGTVAFQWSGNEFVFLMNRDRWDFLEEEHAKVTSSTLQCEDEMWGGSWLRYKQGRFAFLLDGGASKYSTTLIPRFFECAMSPSQFAEDLAQKEAESFGLKLHLVVADINSESMVYISKDNTRLRIDNVAHGVHTISLTGFDSNSHKDEVLRRSFLGGINIADCNNEELQIQNVVEWLMNDSRSVFIDMFDSSGKAMVPHTKHILGLQVKANSAHAHFYEKLFKDDGNCEDRLSHFDK